MSAWENWRLEYSPNPVAGTVIANTNPYFEPPTNTTGWLGVNGATIDASSAQAHQGTQSMRVTPDGVTAVPQVQSDRMAVTAGVSYNLHAWARSATADTRKCAVFWFDSADVFFSSSEISQALSPGVWTEYGPQACVCPITGFARLVSNDPGTPAASHTWRVDEFTLGASLTTLPEQWTDITAYARDPSGGPPVRIVSGSDRGVPAAPAILTVSLENIDHRFLFGSSAVATGWAPGHRIRCYEVIGNRRIDLFSGYLQPPETGDWAEQGVDQFVTVTAVDRLGRFATARPFVSTLAEHILYHGPPVAYWTLLDSTPPMRPNRPVTQSPLNITYTSITATGTPTGTPQGGTLIPGDDVAPLRLVPAITGTSVTFEANLSGTINRVAATGTDTLSLVFWLYLEDPATSDIQFGGTNTAADTYIRLQRIGTNWSITAALGSGATTFAAPWPIPGRWNLIALRFSNFVGTGVISYLRNDDGEVAASIGAASTNPTFDSLNFEGFQGNIAHVQLYTTAASYTPAIHLAQYAEGFSGLANQTTGARIRTLAGYAGIPTTEMSYIDGGTSYMTRATLAGQTPLAEMAAAETTEQGRLRADGRGVLVFDPRSRRYQS